MSYTYHSEETIEVRLQEQRKFVFRLGKLMKTGFLPVFIDETSTNLWEKGVKMWWPKNLRHKVMLNKVRGKGITIIGALQSSCEPYHSFTTCKSTTAPDFLDFIQHFISWIRENHPEESKKMVLIMDNHSSHQSQVLDDYINSIAHC